MDINCHWPEPVHNAKVSVNPKTNKKLKNELLPTKLSFLTPG